MKWICHYQQKSMGDTPEVWNLFISMDEKIEADIL